MNRTDVRSAALLATAFIGTLAGSLFWTGFPVGLSRAFGGELSFSFIYMFAIGGALLFDLVGGVFADIKNVKTVAVTSLVVSSLLLTWLALIGINKFLILTLLPLVYFNFSLGTIAESVWLLKASSNLKESFLNRRVATISSKIFGFACGPILFSLPLSLAIGVCAALFFICAIIQFVAIPGVRSAGVTKLRDSTDAVKSLLKKPVLTSALLLTGFLTVPISPLFIGRLSPSSDLKTISAYWFLSGLASLAAVLLLKKKSFLTGSVVILLFAGCSALCFAIAFISGSAGLIVMAGPIYVFLSVALSAALQTNIIIALPTKTMGASLGAIDALVDLGTFIGLLFGALADHSHLLTAGVVISLIIARGLSQSRFNQQLGPSRILNVT